MFERILSALPEGNRKFPLRYLRMIMSISDRMCLARNRYLLAHPIRTPGMELLRYLCLNLNITALNEYTNDEDRYTEIIKFYKDTYRSIIDPNFSNTIRGGRFISAIGGVAPCEIFLNCESKNPIMDLPFDKDWNDWKDLRAVRMLYHDSLELPEDLSRSMFDFKVFRPTYLVIGLNVPILAFKFYKYTVACTKNHLDIDVDHFLKNYEYTHFFDDLFNIWILNLITRITTTSESTDDIIKNIAVPMRFCTVNMLRQGIDGFKEYIDLLKNNSIKPQDFLCTRWFPDNHSLSDVMNEIDHWISLPQLQRYLWLNVINWYPYLYLILELVKLLPADNPIRNNISIRCNEVWIRKFKTINMVSAVNSPLLNSVIKLYRSKVEKLLNGVAAPAEENIKDSVC